MKYFILFVLFVLFSSLTHRVWWGAESLGKKKREKKKTLSEKAPPPLIVISFANGPSRNLIVFLSPL